jgi:hypothetical protein
MSSSFDQVFWRAVDDLNAGQFEEVETYLELVPSTERDELAALLADVLSTRGPSPAAGTPTSEGYARALAVIDDVAGSAGPSGVLPEALRTIRHSRGIDRDLVVATLAHDFDIESGEGKKALERYYHLLESGRLLGSHLTRRLLASLAKLFELDLEDVYAGAQPTAPLAPAQTSPAFGRASGHSDVRTAGERQLATAMSDEERLVERLFTGGPDA